MGCTQQHSWATQLGNQVASTKWISSDDSWIHPDKCVVHYGVRSLHRASVSLRWPKSLSRRKKKTGLISRLAFSARPLRRPKEMAHSAPSVSLKQSPCHFPP